MLTSGSIAITKTVTSRSYTTFATTLQLCTSTLERHLHFITFIMIMYLRKSIQPDGDIAESSADKRNAKFTFESGEQLRDSVAHRRCDDDAFHRSI